jgi:PEP-CTERM/exosortase A-associated glycosyltransferase
VNGPLSAAPRSTPPPVILHVFDHALPEWSGYSIRSHNVLRALRARGLPVVGVAPSTSAVRFEEEVDGVPYVRLPHASGLGNLARMLRLYGDLRRQCAGRSVALVHAHNPARTGIPALWAARRARLPIVYELHGLWEEAAVGRRRMRPHSVRYRLGRQLETSLMRRVDVLAAISRGLIDEARRRGVAAERIVHVPNCVDAHRFRPRDPDVELVDRHALHDKIVLGFIGSFFAYEGIEVLIRAFALLVRQFPAARLLLVGDGDVHGELCAEIERRQLQQHVVMPGRVSHAEVPRYYSICDVLVYPRPRSRLTEMVTPLRPLEAMAMGRAVVASDLGALREMVQHGATGLLVSPDDAAGLAAALATLAADPGLRRRLGEGARRFVVEERDWRSLAGVYEAAYARLLGAPATADATVTASG